jgi:hypothetical protein
MMGIRDAMGAEPLGTASMPRLINLAFIGTVLAFVVVLAVLWVAPQASAQPGTVAAHVAVPPHTPHGLPSGIEPLAAYVPQVACDQRTHPGTRALARLLTRTYPDTTTATTYACGTDGVPSEHSDGRAIDWMANVRDHRQHAEAKATLHWLLAADSSGNRFAMARRLGVMYLIYDNRMWGAWDGTWEDYNGCAHLPARAYDNQCHRTHVHISLGWAGAMGATSFWTKQVAGTDYGPCRARDLNWAGTYQRPRRSPCPRYPDVTAPRHASATKVALIEFSGAEVRPGWGGPATSAIQRALNVPATGVFAAATKAAVRKFQRNHGLAASGVVNQRTWRLLLKSVH